MHRDVHEMYTRCLPLYRLIQQWASFLFTDHAYEKVSRARFTSSSDLLGGPVKRILFRAASLSNCSCHEVVSHHTHNEIPLEL
jgi:hypothetical protein